MPPRRACSQRATPRAELAASVLLFGQSSLLRYNGGTLTQPSNRQALTLSELKKRFGICLPLTAEQWAFAALLGGARTLTNQDRAESSDREQIGNARVDLYGALGELVLYGLVRELPDSRDALVYMRGHLFSAKGGRGVKGADLVFRNRGVSVGVDVKTFDCSPDKYNFAINYAKHVELGKNDICVGYMGLVCPKFGRNACITRLIPYAHVSAWKRWNLRKIKGSISCNRAIGTAMREYGLPSYSFADNRIDVHSEEDVLRLARLEGEGSPIERLSRMLPAAAPYLRKTQAAL